MLSVERIVGADDAQQFEAGDAGQVGVGDHEVDLSRSISASADSPEAARSTR